MSGTPQTLVDTSFVTLHAPWSVGLSFLGLELVVVICGALALAHALGERRRGDGGPLFAWGVSFTYGIVMELLSYNFIDSFSHGQFTVMFYRHQLPLYVVTLYPVLQYTSIMTARRLRLRLLPEAVTAGLLMVAMDAPFDILGAHQHWWAWSASDPNVAFRWHDVPVTSYLWHLLFGGILAGVTRVFGLWGGDRQRPYRIAALALPLSALTIVLGALAFLPFHLLKSLGLPDGIIVAGFLALSVAVAVFSPRAPGEDTADPRLFAIPLIYYAYFGLVALTQLAAAPAAFGGRMAVIASVIGLTLFALRRAHRSEPASLPATTTASQVE
jgi:hypothetical protein